MLCAVFSAAVIQIKQCEQSVLRDRVPREGSLERVPVKVQGESLAAVPAFKRNLFSSRHKLLSLSHGAKT